MTAAAHKIGSWADDECWYCSIVDGPKFALLLGPFRTEAACREYAHLPEDGGNLTKHLAMVHKAGELDPKSAFYGFGMVKMQNGYRAGVLNKHLDVPVSDYYGSSSNFGQSPEFVPVAAQRNA